MGNLPDAPKMAQMGWNARRSSIPRRYDVGRSVELLPPRLPRSIKYEVRLPWTPRLMVFFGSALLVIVGAQSGLRYFRQRRK
jgi:hypothetical protein